MADLTYDDLFTLLTLVESYNERQKENGEPENTELEQKLLDFVYDESLQLWPRQNRR